MAIANKRVGHLVAAQQIDDDIRPRILSGALRRKTSRLAYPLARRPRASHCRAKNPTRTTAALVRRMICHGPFVVAVDKEHSVRG